MADSRQEESTKPVSDAVEVKKIKRDRIIDSKDVEKYICPCCDCLLEDAVQSGCGHRLCKKCAIDMFER